MCPLRQTVAEVCFEVAESEAPPPSFSLILSQGRNLPLEIDYQLDRLRVFDGTNGDHQI